MINCFKILLFITMILPMPANNPVCQHTQNLKVTYVACEGFILESGDKKIAIDAFPAARFLKSQGLSKEIIGRMENGDEPFNNIDIIFVTHSHFDHFDPGLAVGYLEQNPTTILVCPQQVFNIIVMIGGHWDVAERIMPVTGHKMYPFVLDDIRISPLTLPHGKYFDLDQVSGEQKNRHGEVENIGYLICFNEWNIFHAGDNHLQEIEIFESSSLKEEPIDIAFVQSLFRHDGKFITRRDILRDLIAPGEIVLMHLQVGGSPIRITDEMREEFPETRFFSDPLQWREFKK